MTYNDVDELMVESLIMVYATAVFAISLGLSLIQDNNCNNISNSNRSNQVVTDVLSSLNV
jgi:hypothetical protein